MMKRTLAILSGGVVCLLAFVGINQARQQKAAPVAAHVQARSGVQKTAVLRMTPNMMPLECAELQWSSSTAPAAIMTTLKRVA